MAEHFDILTSLALGRKHGRDVAGKTGVERCYSSDLE